VKTAVNPRMEASLCEETVRPALGHYCVANSSTRQCLRSAIYLPPVCPPDWSDNQQVGELLTFLSFLSQYYLFPSLRLLFLPPLCCCPQAPNLMAKTTIGMDGQIPWDPAMELGVGYEIDKFQIVQSALTDLKTTQSAPKQVADVQFQSHVVRSEEELISQIDVSAGASGSVTPLFSLEASSAFLRSIKCNSTTMTTIIRCTITSCSQETLSSCRLTKDAEKCLKKPVFGKKTPEKFLNRYGQYYVWGKVSESTLVAICTHTATSKEKLEKFKSKLGGNYNFTMLEAVVDFMRKATSSKIDTKINVNMTGSGTAAVSESLSATAFEKVLKGFLENHVPVPRAAILKHYSYLDQRLPKPQVRFIIPPAITEAYQSCLDLEVRSRSCSMDKAKEILPKLADVRKELSGVRPSMDGWEKDVSTLHDKLLALKADMDKFFEVKALLQQTKSASTSIERKKWNKANQTVAWTAGTTNHMSATLASEIKHQKYEFTKGLYSVPCSTRVIIGFRVESRRLDGSNGSWRLKEGWVGTHDHLEVEFSADLFHKSKWTLEVWSVDKDMYAERV
jgi:hypothetical protein